MLGKKLDQRKMLHLLLANRKDNMHGVVLSHFSYDVVFTAGQDKILQKYKESNSEVLFSAEDFCWPDKSLEVSKYICMKIIIVLLFKLCI